MQSFRQKTYVTYIQGPAAAVILAAISGYGINSLTGGGSGTLGYAGFLMALPIPLAMVIYSGMRQARHAEFEERWPPVSLVATDRVQVRYVLRRVKADAGSTEADPAQLEAALDTLLDKAHAGGVAGPAGRRVDGYPGAGRDRPAGPAQPSRAGNGAVATQPLHIRQPGTRG